uniref:Uncharacterized protein n=1 Tax=Oryza rufipogon TaxID=4529 RepID=A0A0E0RKB4_ORYRU
MSSSRSTTSARRSSSKRQVHRPRASTISWTHSLNLTAATPSTTSTSSPRRTARRARSSSSHGRLRFLASAPRCCMLPPKNGSGESWMVCTMRFRQLIRRSWTLSFLESVLIEKNQSINH